MEGIEYFIRSTFRWAWFKWRIIRHVQNIAKWENSLELMVEIASPICLHIDAPVELYKWIDIIDTEDADIQYDGWSIG